MGTLRSLVNHFGDLLHIAGYLTGRGGLFFGGGGTLGFGGAVRGVFTQLAILGPFIILGESML